MEKYIQIIFGLIILLASCSDEKNNLKPINQNICIDKDGKTYKSIIIGKQIWMSENLAYLPEINKKHQSSISEARYYVYMYNGVNIKEAQNSDNYKNYGVLYNYKAAIQSVPKGWHIPSDEEWKELEIYIGILKEQTNNINFRGSENISIKSRSINMWTNNNGTNYYGLNIFPAGIINDSFFKKAGNSSFLWTSSESSSTNVWSREFSHIHPGISRTRQNKRYGLSIRCIKDK
ncbi:MAG: fibrobacter succinogenes major paralogous domain-containing protein [Marinifilaceae bacterium]